MPRLRLDLHVHSVYSSDGVMTPKQIVGRARVAGLDGVAITDHDTIRGGVEAQKLAAGDLEVIVGAEIMTDEGEVIGLFLKEEIEERTLERVVEAIRSQGGLVVIPHPFDSVRRSALRPGDEQAALADAIEVFNSRCVLNRFNRAAEEYARRHALPGVAGSDAHFANEIGKAGIIVTERDVKDAIVNSRVQVFGRRSPIIVHAFTKVKKALGRLP
jgi:predicted metal-dependent phosphoesterase TrpH